MMLEHFYQSPCSLRLLRGRPFLEHMDGLAGKLYQMGYGRKYAQRILWSVGKFNEFAQKVGVETADEINEQLMRRFLHEEVKHDRVVVSAALVHYWKHLREQGIVPIVLDQAPNDRCESTLRNFFARYKEVTEKESILCRW